MQVFIDIETLPDLRPGKREAFIKDAAENVKAPATYTKDQLAADLGITDKDTIKFTGKDSLAAQWAELVGPSKAEEIGDAEWRKTSFDATQGQILMIGVALDGNEPEIIQGDEQQLLAQFHEWLGEVYSQTNHGLPQFVGHNLIDFDLPFIFRRSVILGACPHPSFPIMPSRYSERVYDTMAQWAGFGNRIKLDALAKALGVGSKGDIDGSMVYDYYAAGRIDELAEYCKNDVRLTRDVWQRMTFQEAA